MAFFAGQASSSFSLSFLSAASTNEGPCASFSNSARMPLIFLMGIYVKNKIYEPQRTRRRRKNKDLGTAAGLLLSDTQWIQIYFQEAFQFNLMHHRFQGTFLQIVYYVKIVHNGKIFFLIMLTSFGNHLRIWVWASIKVRNTFHFFNLAIWTTEYVLKLCLMSDLKKNTLSLPKWLPNLIGIISKHFRIMNRLHEFP